MTVMLEMKEKLRSIYAQYGTWVQMILKFLLALVIFSSINGMLGYMKLLDNLFIVLIMALLCAILPLSGIVVFGGFMIIGHCFALGVEVGGLALILFLLMYFLFFRFVPKDGLAVILSPIACSFGMPSVVPLGLGLTRGGQSAVSASLGVILYYFLKTVKDVIEPLKEAKEQDILKNIQVLIGDLLKNQELFIYVIGCAAVVIIVSAVRKLSSDYAWYLSIASGAGCFLIICGGGSIFLQTSVSFLSILIGILGAGLIALILEFFLFHVDYRKSETLQFQDDYYVYFVKAVPRLASDRWKRELMESYGKNSRQENEAEGKNPSEIRRRVPVEEKQDFSNVDFEAKLEESLKLFQDDTKE